jgi:outer membrane cobalamin receptor
MNNKRLKLTLICFFSLCISFTAYASDSDEDKAAMKKMLTLDMEELMTISVASKREEKIEGAPGVISVITAKDIQSYGAMDLRDLLMRLPNTYIFMTSLFRDSVTSFRGGNARGSDNHELILLNGRPMREGFNGTITAPIYRNIPLEIIEKIEVIRGPGSVLYGTNAFSGVINIVTKKPTEKMDASITGGYGSFNTAFTSASASQKVDDVELLVAGRALNSTGWNFEAKDLRGVPGSQDYDKNNYGYLGQGSYKDLTLTGFSGRINEDVLVGITGLWSAKNKTSDWERNFFDAQYEHDLNQTWKTRLNFTLNNVNGDSQGRLRSFNDFLFEPSLYGKLFDRVNTVAGFTYLKQEGNLITENTPYSNDRFSTYLQGDYSPMEFLKLIGGVQVNKQQGLDYNFSPRGGAIVNFNPNTGLKLLYGEAYRSATGAEQLPTAVSPPAFGLKPEINSTFDAQLFYSTPKYYTAFTYYRTHLSDAIVTVSDPLGIKSVNAGSIDYQGIELEGKAAITPHLDFTGSVSRQFNEDDTGNTEIGRVPQLMVKTGAAYNWEKGYSLGLFNNHYSDAGTIAGARMLNPPASGYDFLTLNASMNVRKVTGLSGIPDIKINLYGDNLLKNDLVFFPVMGAGTAINTLPILPGRAFYGSVSVRY